MPNAPRFKPVKAYGGLSPRMPEYWISSPPILKTLPFEEYVKTVTCLAIGFSSTTISEAPSSSGAARVYVASATRSSLQTGVIHGSLGFMHAVSVCIPAWSPAACIFFAQDFISSSPPGNAVLLTGQCPRQLVQLEFMWRLENPDRLTKSIQASMSPFRTDVNT